MADRPPARSRIALADVPALDVRRALVTGALFLVVLSLFLWMVHEMLVAGLLGGILAAYLRPVHRWIAERTGREALAAVVTLVLLIVPALALLVYGYLEIRDAAEYLASHTAEVAAQISGSLDRLPFLGNVEAQASIEGGLARAAELATGMPAGVQDVLSEFAVDTSVFLFTAFYVLTGADTIVAYLRGKVPPRYAALAERLEEHVQGVLYGAVYGTLLTQTMKAALVLALNLVFGVPLPVVLALLAFVIGFFPVVGSWTIYLPAAGYLLVFQDAPWEALAMLVLGLGISTVFLSLIVRPKLAAEKSYVLNFYWMFVGLVAGVYTFGVPGIVIGPVVVGLLKAVLDTITTDLDWLDDGEGEGPDAEVLPADEVRKESPPPEA
jgi:predicted PurR-regulated permease PerM